jgi:2-polyprenyl-3-methyl-5-hydroxy-6-metoxy-1,4-benzoquinol methylase
MSEYKLFSGPPPEFTTPGWYAGRERAAHLEQAGHRDRLYLAADHALALADRLSLRSAVDLGCGDGGLLSLIRDRYSDRSHGSCWGYDLCPAAVDAARDARGVSAYLTDVVGDPDRVTWADLAVATEMLEHLADPHAFAREIGKHCRAIVASSPANESTAVHYEFHAWAWDMDGYRKLIEQAGFRVSRHDLVFGGFQVISGVRE